MYVICLTVRTCRLLLVVVIVIGATKSTKPSACIIGRAEAAAGAESTEACHIARYCLIVLFRRLGIGGEEHADGVAQ